MLTYTALTTLDGGDAAEALGAALEKLDPAPTGVGVFEIEDGKDLWEVGGLFHAAAQRSHPRDVRAGLWRQTFCHFRSARN